MAARVAGGARNQNRPSIVVQLESSAGTQFVLFGLQSHYERAGRFQIGTGALGQQLRLVRPGLHRDRELKVAMATFELERHRGESEIDSCKFVSKSDFYVRLTP